MYKGRPDGALFYILLVETGTCDKYVNWLLMGMWHCAGIHFRNIPYALFLYSLMLK